MATVTASYNWVSGETVTPTKLNTAAAPTVVVADNEVTTAKILNDAVTTAKILDANVTTAKIADANVTAAKLASNAVETAKIADGAVVNAKLADGAVVQVVQGSTTTVTTISSATASHEIPADNTKPQSTEGVEILTQAITPKSNTNKVLVRAICPFALEGANTPIIALFKNSDANAMAASYISTSNAFNGMLVIEYLDSPATTSATTYKIRAGRGSAGTFYVNGASGGVARFDGTLATTLTLIEIKAS
jgi:hypothetical protein